MLRKLKVWICGMYMLATVSTASAFSLLGPLGAEGDWQVASIAYQLAGDNGTPRNIAEEYRWNTPILYYAFDVSFLDYFGSNGVAAVEQAVLILNALTNVSSYSQNLAEFPFDAQRMNFQASALNLLDVKSLALEFMIEELGLAEPTRWTWTIRDRVVGQGGCPANVTYTVTKRNLDPVTGVYSSYVNNMLLTYQVFEDCGAGPAPDADAIEILVDPLINSPAVADLTFVSGSFFVNLTRDDVGGLRYLWRTNNVNTEPVDPASTLIATTATNGNFLQLTTTSDLRILTEAAATNNAANLQALFPDLVITSTTSTFQLVVSSNFVAFFTNYPFSSAGTPASLVTTTVYTTNIQQRFTHVFANVVTNPFFLNTTNGLVFTNRSAFTNARVTIVTTEVTVPPFAPPGSPPQTTVSTQTRTENFINGEYFIIPANVCGFEVLSNLLTQVTPITTTVTATDNTATNVQGQAFSQTRTTFFTNHTFLVRVTPCPDGTNVAAARQGIEKLTFVRRSYDSLVGQFFEPVTTNFNLKAIGGNQLVTETYRRTVNQPDFLFAAADLNGPVGGILQQIVMRRTIPNTVNGSATLPGPGIIQSPITITYNKVGPIYVNQTPFFLTELSATKLFVYGSFDGTTNAPVVYPSGTSIANLENQVLIQITPNLLPSGDVGLAYSQQLGVVGGQPPYNFSLAPGSPGLPPGLSLSATGLISGTPTSDDAFDFIVRMIDSGARQVDRVFTIVINP